MNKAKEEGFLLIKNNFKLKELEIGENKKVTIYRFISFYSKVYYIEDIGILSIMTLNLGLIQMISLTINPFEKDLPQVSDDLIYAFDNRKYIFEFFKLMINNDNKEYNSFIKKIDEIKEKYSELENYKLKEGWYSSLISTIISKSGNSRKEEKLLNLYKESIEAYIEYAKIMTKLNEHEIKKKKFLIKNFADELIKKKSFSIEVFKNTIGIEKSRKLIGDVTFGFISYDNFNKNKTI